MGKKIVVLVCMLFSCFAISQNEKKLNEVTYIFDINLENYSEGIPYRAELHFNDSTSLFVYNTIHLEGEAGFRRFVRDRTGRVDGISHFGEYDDKGNIFYLDLTTKELTSRQLYGYYINIVNERNIDFNWQITEETKKIGDYLCFKATTENFRGRNYEAWFTHEIPVSTGPWKFHGLPGLILEVHDDKDLVNITFEKMSKVSPNYVNFKKPISRDINTLEMYLEECFRLYLLFVDRQKEAIIQGIIPSNLSHPSPYVNLEYNEDQIKLLNQYLEIEYENYEKSKDVKD